MKNKHLAALLAIAAILVSHPALAEDGYNAQFFWPSIFGGNFVAIEDANTLCTMGFGGGLLVNYANRPIEVRVEEDPKFGVLNQLLTADVLAAFGPVSFISIGADVPLHLYVRGRTYEDIGKGTDVSGLENELTLGDIRAEIKVRALRQDKHWLGLALAPFATFPTGDETMFLGEGRITGGGNLILEHDFRIFNIGLNGGYQYRGEAEIVGVDVGDAWKFGAGISREFENGLSFSIEGWGTMMNSEDEDSFKANPMEAMATLRYKFGANRPRVLIGGGGGLTEGVGSPAYRLMAGVDYYYCKPKPTKGTLAVTVVDQNGKPLQAQVKVSGPMSFDFGTDSSGKWLSKADPGQYQADASKEGYQPASGSGIVQVDQTTEIKLTLRVIPTTLTVTVVDKYTQEKLDSQIVFDKGTPNEKTMSLPNGELTNPWEPGVYKMMVTSTGYEIKLTEASVTKGEDNVVKVELRRVIVKMDNIYFDYDSDVIRTMSYPVLDDVVRQINELPSYKRIIIEGHCSSEGSDAYNMDLSGRRAQSVKNYLANKGIDPEKLTVEAYGESRPIDTNDTEEGKSRNRRVEFIIEYE